MEIVNSPYFDFLILPLLIFLMRICDVTLDTMRIIFMTKGYRNVAPIIGFFEILIWIVAITRIMQNLSNWATYVAYAAGFATGNYVGMLLDEKLAIGHELIRVITRVDSGDLAKTLRSEGFGVTSVNAHGMQGEVGILYVIVNRKNQKMAVNIIQKHSPNAFFTVENIHFVNRPLDRNFVTDPPGTKVFPFGRGK
ncbi:MAG: DUF2179 domain-containing protein [Bacteroidales bacterium]|nr:DUF2179 domain-containing protein [Bacteroidales bacterium]